MATNELSSTLSALQQVPESAQYVNFALDGNTDGLKDLFVHVLASTEEFSVIQGEYIMLCWAIYGRRDQMCKLFINAGADSGYRRIAILYNSSRIKAHQALPMDDFTQEGMKNLVCLTQGSDFISEHISRL